VTQVQRAIDCAADKSNADPRILLGSLLFAQGRFDEAAIASEACLRNPGICGMDLLWADPSKDVKPPFAVESLLNRPLSQAWEKAGDLDRAIDYAETALTRGPLKGDNLRIAELIVRRNADYADAYRYLQKEPALSPELKEDRFLSIALAVSDAVGLPHV
jgi:tetratricopeptide (TPR) repeat protein